MVDIVDGFYVIELIGMGVNGLIGDYSCGVLGFWIVNGEIVGLVVEVMIVGNLKDMFVMFIFVDDFEFCYVINVLIVWIDGMMFVGV